MTYLINICLQRQRCSKNFLEKAKRRLRRETSLKRRVSTDSALNSCTRYPVSAGQLQGHWYRSDQFAVLNAIRYMNLYVVHFELGRSLMTQSWSKSDDFKDHFRQALRYSSSKNARKAPEVGAKSTKHISIFIYLFIG